MKLPRAPEALMLALTLTVIASKAAPAQSPPIVASPSGTLAPPEAPLPPTVRPSARSAMIVAPTPPEIMPLPPLPARPDLAAARDRLKRPADPPPLPTPVQMQLRSVAAPAPSAPKEIVPPGATGRCKDGSYFSGSATEGRCADAKGLAYLLPR